MNGFVSPFRFEHFLALGSAANLEALWGRRCGYHPTNVSGMQRDFFFGSSSCISSLSSHTMKMLFDSLNDVLSHERCCRRKMKSPLFAPALLRPGIMLPPGPFHRRLPDLFTAKETCSFSCRVYAIVPHPEMPSETNFYASLLRCTLFSPCCSSRRPVCAITHSLHISVRGTLKFPGNFDVKIRRFQQNVFYCSLSTKKIVHPFRKGSSCVHCC